MTETDIPLSLTQEFLCLFAGAEGTGPFGPRYLGVRGWRVQGSIDAEQLRSALGDAVARHEALRTELVRDAEGTGGHQRVHPPTPPALEVLELAVPESELPLEEAREVRAQEFLNELEAGELPVEVIPHLRAVLGRFDDKDAVLALVAHHVAIDGWSMQVIVEEVAAAFSDARTAPAAQYRDYARWQRTARDDDRLAQAVAHWSAHLHCARMLGVAVDRPAPEGVARVTSVCRFAVAPSTVRAVLDTAREARSTTFMVMQAAYNLLLVRTTGSHDVVVPTITAGRGDVAFERTVGPFFNFVPLRTDLAGAETGREVLQRTRRTCIDAQIHEVPFAAVLAQAPELMTTFGDPHVAVGAFQTFQYGDEGSGSLGDAGYSEIRRRTISHAVGSDIPDGVLWTVEIDPFTGEAYGNVRFDAHQYDMATVEGHVAAFLRALDDVVADGPVS